MYIIKNITGHKNENANCVCLWGFAILPLWVRPKFMKKKRKKKENCSIRNLVGTRLKRVIPGFSSS